MSGILSSGHVTVNLGFSRASKVLRTVPFSSAYLTEASNNFTNGHPVALVVYEEIGHIPL